MDTLTSINNLAALKAGQGVHAEAEELLRETVQGLRATLGPQHPHFLTALFNVPAPASPQGPLGEP